MRAKRGWVNAIGPGVLYAATAVGASHLVQSTRAGASYGLALVLLIGLTFIAKYPAFRFGAQYASATGHSLLHGYRRQGRWAVIVYVIIALGTVFAALPAVTLLTAGLAKVAFGLPLGTLAISAIILAGCVAILIGGGYHLLDRLVKVLMVFLTLATLVATVLVLPRLEWSAAGSVMPRLGERADVFFIVALLGMMPTSVDISVWHSLWSVAKARDTAHRPSLRESMLDFHLGYIGSFVLALCFVLLGAGVMYNAGAQFVPDAAGFAAQFIDLYRNSLGAWSGPFIGVIAVAVMFSTVLTGMDGYPRAAVALAAMWAGGEASEVQMEDPGTTTAPVAAELSANGRAVYITAVAVLALGSLAILYFLVTSLRLVIDFASTILFLFAPVVAWLNHRAMTGLHLPAAARPGRGLRALSLVGVLWMAAFSIWFLYLRISA